MIALIHTLVTNEEETGIRKVLVVCPLSTVLNWVAEFKKWLPEDEIEVFELVSSKQNMERMYQVKEWDRVGGALVLGYDMFRNLTNPTNKRLSKRLRNTFQTCLVDPGKFIVRFYRVIYLLSRYYRSAVGNLRRRSPIEEREDIY